MVTNLIDVAPSPKTAQALETQISSGDADAMKAYVTDAFEYHLQDRDELHRRRKFLGHSVPEASTPIECMALISAAMDDQKGWALMIDALDGGGDPGLGYLAWRMLLYHSKDPKHAERWMHAVDHSATQGHFPSRRRVLLRELENGGFLCSFKVRRRLYALERERQRHEATEPNSRLLADYTKRPKTFRSELRRLFSKA